MDEQADKKTKFLTLLTVTVFLSFIIYLLSPLNKCGCQIIMTFLFGAAQLRKKMLTFESKTDKGTEAT